MNDNLALLQAITRAHARFHSGDASEAALLLLLESLLELTSSQHGLIAELVRGDAERPHLCVKALADRGASRAHDDRAAADLEIHDMNTLLGTVVTTGERVLSTPPASDWAGIGLPNDHRPLECFAGIPIESNGRVIGVVGIANRPGGYESALLDSLDPLISTCGVLLEAWRNAFERKKAEEALLRRMQTDRLVSELTSSLVEVPAERIGSAATSCLGAIAAHLGADRIVYFTASEQERLLRRILSWGALPPTGIGPDEVSFDLFPELERRLRAETVVMVADVGELVGEDQLQLEELGIRSAAFVAARLESGEVSAVFVLHWWTQRPVHQTQDLEALTNLSAAIAAALRRKDTEQSLRESEERFRNVANSAPVMIWLATLDSRVTFANDALYDFLGLDSTGQLVESGMDSIHPNDRDELLENFSTSLSEGRPVTFECRMLFRGCEWRSVLMSGTPRRSSNGRFEGFICSAVDISERRRLEQQLLESNKLEAVGRLAGGIAHDFNNILTAVLGCSEAALEYLPGGHPAAESVSEIEDSAQRAAALTRQLLAFARRQPAAPRVVDLNLLVTRVKLLLRRLIGEHIELEFEAYPELPPVQIDPSQLEQVLVNLTVNARDAMPGGGTLTIRTDARAQKAGKQASWVSVSITDTGTGMDEVELAHAFEPFYTTKDVGHGTGLGLATCYGIVTQAGGSISAQSVPGRGTTFEILLPASSNRLQETEAETPVERVSVRSSETILLVEDEPAVRRVLAAALRAAGFEVLEASDGAEARKWLDEIGERPQIDLLVTDVVMPSAGGVEVARWVRAAYPECRVLFVSGYNDAMLDASQLDARSDFLGKPFRTASLVSSARALLDRS